jgi:hypothetical protein
MMAKTAFVSLEVENGRVVRVDGSISPDLDFFESLFSSGPSLFGKSVTDALNTCAEEGYEHFFTEAAGGKTIYRLKLVSR